MTSNYRHLFLGLVVAATGFLFTKAEAQNQLNETCEQKLQFLGVRDKSSLDYFCDGRKIDYKCLEDAVYSGSSSGSEALPKCSEISSGDSIVITKSALSGDEIAPQIHSQVKVWTGTNVALSFGLVGALRAEKSCIRGPFIDSEGHKVVGHGGGNALGAALIGWATENCDNGVKAMILMSAAREQMKISRGGSCEWNSMLWDGIGITAGGELCQWLEKNVTRPQFLQELSEKVFGHKSSISIVPNGAFVNKQF